MQAKYLLGSKSLKVWLSVNVTDHSTGVFFHGEVETIKVFLITIVTTIVVFGSITVTTVI